MKFVSTLLLLFLFSDAFSQNILENAEEAYLKAEKENKKVLMIFSGSDWCAGCIRLHKKILMDSSFIRWSDQNMIILLIDFPQQKKQTRERKEQNDSLAALYNTDGRFPEILLMENKNHVIAEISGGMKDSEQFIREIGSFLLKSGKNE